MNTKGIEGHARIPPPGWEDLQAEAGLSGISLEAAADKLLRLRASALELEATDPLRNGYEPPIWHVCDALLGFPWCYDKAFLRAIRKRWTDQTDRDVWEWFCEAMRKHLGYERPVKMLLILGGNRAAKSEYAAKRAMMMIAEKENANVYAMHMSEPRSKRDQQPLFWKYMPLEWQVQTAGLLAYIKYKKKTGFAENSFITPIGSQGAFLNYMQDKDTALQGMEADVVAPDELIPADWVDDILLRLATRAGMGILTFTPINGYTPTVKIFCDSAKIVKTIRAYLCPRDGRDPDEARALHLTTAQYKELWKAVDERREAMAPQSQPEDVLDWLEAGRSREEEDTGRRRPEAGRSREEDAGGRTPDAGRSREEDARGRTPEAGRSREEDAGGRRTEAGPANLRTDRVFDEVPRVLRCVDPRKAVVYFNPSDNPYGNPKEVIADLRKKSKAYVRERFYGQAEKTISVMIPKFSRKIHVIPASRIPAEGTNYFFYDPASDRNSFMSWFRRRGADTFLYREWPGKYYIPGVGIPGPWAIPSGRKDGRNDGDPGEGQKPSFGFGLARYKFEMARLERWDDYKTWRDDQTEGARRTPDGYPNDEDLVEWDTRDEEGNPTRAEEIILSRFIDSRAASSPRIEKDRPVTLQTLFDDINVFFFLTPGADIADGVSKINSALDYELDEDDGRQTPEDGSERKFINPARFFVSEECENSIYAFENWMNADGQNGACKDPIDLPRYFFTSECEDVGPSDYQPRGGVSYGRAPGGTVNRVYRGARRLPR